MRSRCRCPVLAGLIALVAGSPLTLAGSITVVTTSRVASTVGRFALPSTYVGDADTFNNSPASGTQGPVYYGISYDPNASSSFSLSGPAFDLTFEHSNSFQSIAFAQTTAELWFQPDVNMTYSFSGAYTATSGPAIMQTLVELAELGSLGTPLYSNENVNGTTSPPNSTLHFTGSEGDSNSSTGQATGALLAGHTYRLYVSAMAGVAGTSGSARTDANGEFHMTLVPAAVPLPSSAASGVLLVTVLAAIRTCRQLRRYAATS